jgi:hypothetical protein
MRSMALSSLKTFLGDKRNQLDSSDYSAFGSAVADLLREPKSKSLPK